MLIGMTETHQKSPSDPPEHSDPNDGDESVAPEDVALALPSHIASSGTLDRWWKPRGTMQGRLFPKTPSPLMHPIGPPSPAGAGCAARTPSPRRQN